MRICLVTPYDLSRHGGVNKHVLGLASALRRMGDEVEVIGPASDELTKPGPSPAARVTGFGGVVSIDGNGSENRLGIWTSPFQIWSYFRRHSFDVIHVHEPLLPLLPYYALWSADARVRFATFHCYPEHESRRSRWARQLMAPYLRAYNRGIAVSEPAARYARVAWSRPLTIVPNGVDVAFFRPSKTDVSPRVGGPTRLLFVGQYTDARKGFGDLLAAYGALRSRGVDVVLDVVGNGDPRAPAPPAQNGVVFRGRVSELSLRAQLSKCDVFVAPSVGSESFGIVLLEAMASGRAIVCSDIDGYRRVASPAGALFVRAGHVPDLVEALSALCADPARRDSMGRNNIAAAQSYDWRLVAREVRDQYQSAIGVDGAAAENRRFPLDGFQRPEGFGFARRRL